MGKHQKLLWTILRGRSDSNIRFADLQALLIDLGFDERVNRSHHIYRREGVRELINLQRDGNKAKAYQVRQILRAVDRLETSMR